MLRHTRRLPAILASAVLVAALPMGALAEKPATGLGSAGALLTALARVPDSVEARQDIVSWLDQDALLATRPGAAQPASGAELAALLESDEPSGELLMAALLGASSGDPEILRRLAFSPRWPTELGFDVTDIGSHLTFGRPPSDGTVLAGTFDPESVAAAFAQRGYTSTVAGGHSLLCGAAGCERGLDVDIARADPGLPFGAELGRSEPLAVSPTDILSSADLATLSAMLQTAAGTAPALADDRAYRAVASAGDPVATLVQATLLPGGMVGLDPTIFAFFSDSPEAAGQLVVTLDEAFEEMPAADVIAVLDGATATEQVVSIALAYADAEDAAATAEILPRRLQALPSLSTGAPLADLLAERGVVTIHGRVIPGGEGTSPVAVVELRAPLAGPGPADDSGRPEPSSRVYRTIVDLIGRRDLLWLAPVLPLE
jgi:hypothetical protein